MTGKCSNDPWKKLSVPPVPGLEKQALFSLQDSDWYSWMVLGNGLETIGNGIFMSPSTIFQAQHFAGTALALLLVLVSKRGPQMEAAQKMFPVGPTAPKTGPELEGCGFDRAAKEMETGVGGK